MISPELDALRAQLDTADALLVRALCMRSQVVADVARLKASQGLPAHDAAREEAVLERAEQLAQEGGADEQAVALVRETLSAVVERCRGVIARQQDVESLP